MKNKVSNYSVETDANPQHSNQVEDAKKDLFSDDSSLQVALAMLDDKKVFKLLQQNIPERSRGSLSLDVARLNGCKSLRYIISHTDEDVAAARDSGQTILHVAVRYGVLPSVELVLERWPELIDVADADNCRPIHRAASRGNTAIMRCLVETPDADVNSISPLGTAVCIAAREGHTALLDYLLQQVPDIDVCLTDAEQETPLHLAIRAGHVECCRLLSAHTKCPVTDANKQQQTVLHYVSEYASWSSRWQNVVDIILQKEADVVAQDNAGETPLHVAVRRSNEQLAGVFIKHLKQKAPRELVQVLQLQDNKHQTPFRCMIRTMPELAEAMLDACIEPRHDASTGQSSLCVDLSLLEDTFEDFNKDGSITLKAKPYNTNYRLIKDNHPLNIISERERHRLLAHPVLKLLLHRKWTWASTLYILFMCFFACHVVSVSMYMITAAPPFQVNQSWCQLNLVDDIVLNLWNEEGQGQLQTGITAAVVILAAIGIVLEVTQLVLSGPQRLKDIHNIMGWFTYVTACVIIIDFTDCKTRADWQWQLGVACVFFAWMNFLFYLHKTPKVGIYIVMIAMILKTFMQFFVVFFLFILAFAITFFLLLQNQYAFRDVFLSVMKTWVMMIGEMDFTDIFHSEQEDDDHHVQVYFPHITYAVFVVFLVMLSLIIMNLLTGLAVSDVKKLLEDSTYQMIRLQITLALDVEFANPVWCHRRAVRRKEVLSLDSGTTRLQGLRRAASDFFYGPLSRDTICREAQAIVNRREGQNDRTEHSSEDMMRNMMDMIAQIMEKVDALERHNKVKGKGKGSSL